MRERLDTEEFAALVAAPLKAEVPLRGDFDARVQRAIAEASRPWWRRTRTLTLSPARQLALAAGLAGIAVLGGIGALRTVEGPTMASAATDTVHVVRFVFADPTAREVFLAGDFNGWSRTATPLEDASGAGQWTVELTLPVGRHEYAFIVDGERWEADPFAMRHRDEFGQESSVVRVGGDARGA
jgi:hypothetical protein